MPYNSKDWVIEKSTTDYLASLKGVSPLPSRRMRVEQLHAYNDREFIAENKGRSPGEKIRIPNNITPWQVAKLIAATEPIRCIRCVNDSSNNEYDILGLYQSDGPKAGTYDTDELTISALIREYLHEITENGIQSVIKQLREEVPHVARCCDPDIIAVNNGLFNFKTKTLEPFSPDKVFLSKSHVDYNPNATNVVIHNNDDGTDWDVESWILELANDDPDIENSIWEIISAICRPFVRWNKAAFFYSTTGNNGKGTLCVLMRNLVGSSSCASISLAEFSKDFVLEPLITASCIIVDENDVGEYIDKAGSMKACITGDTIQINRKYKIPVYYQFHGMMVQCINDMPRIRDKSNSFYRRQIFVPFEKCFTGAERQYIKSDYLYRQDVLEYVLYKALHMSHYTLSVPAASAAVMEEYKLNNDPIREFCDEILPELKWDLAPFQFLFDMYLSWFSHNQPSGGVQRRNTFIRDLIEVVKERDDWIYPGKTSDNRHCRFLGAGNMNGPEPLIIQYNLEDWMNKNYTGGMNTDKICTFQPGSTRYPGIIRANSPLAASLTQGGNTP